MKFIKSEKERLYQIHFILFVSVFVFSYQLRGYVLQGRLKSINLIAVISIIIIILFELYKNINKRMLLVILLISGVFFYSQLLNNKVLSENIVMLACIIIPLVLITITIKEQDFEEIFNLYLKFFNVLVGLLFIFAVIDKFTDNSIAKFLSDTINDTYFYNAVNYNADLRYYSFMGHPLYNTQLFLMFYILNVFAKKYFKMKTNMTWVIIISTLGIAFTASKTGFILLGVCLIFLNTYKKNRLFYYGIMFIFVVLLFRFGFFENLISRFTTGTLTSGRNEMWLILKDWNRFPIKILSGYGSGFNYLYNDYVQGASMAFEYPIRLFQLEYGVVFTILIYILIFLYPSFILLKNKHYRVFIGFMVIFADVNTYNGIGLGMDSMLMFCLYTYILINLSNYLKVKTI